MAIAGANSELVVVPASASPEEAAAIVAALTRFIAQTASAAAHPERESRWLRTAREEALRGELPVRWGEATDRL
jgi:hypothetical protein